MNITETLLGVPENSLASNLTKKILETRGEVTSVPLSVSHEQLEHITFVFVI